MLESIPIPKFDPEPIPLSKLDPETESELTPELELAPGCESVFELK